MNYLGRQPVEIAVNDLAADWIDGDSVDNVVASGLVSQGETLDVVGEDGLDLPSETDAIKIHRNFANLHGMNYLLAVPIRGRASFGDAHTETVDASVLIVGVQRERVGFALVAARAGDQILQRIQILSH